MNLLDHRIIDIDGDIDETMAVTVIKKIFNLYEENQRAIIYLLINSNGGEISSAMSIYDVMNHIDCEFATIALGKTSGIATLLLATGSKGKRYAFNNSTIRMNFNLTSNEYGVNMILEDKSAKKINVVLNKIMACYSKSTGLDKEKVELLSKMDNILSHENLADINLVDEIIPFNVQHRLQNSFKCINKINNKGYYKKIIKHLQKASII
ncbi:ATP-dependent Clp protease, protease subunit [Hathewaya proteolytica DSM 3090]|uniref:ATP-dependent Clp protease proteolytic subunit n=1 Tax=Hathewaya proteolytica DSM 3090 TaxID=1121331 RepID=A0A1M6MWS7_9CLOT|nr:ATP-dependent Clp protease proteolytic subunit [Hathewaya proteolytica]SHJ87869.1 ATP-dependent Clp protease, protease subunit [Hathewaya proteolytica DSM 3090]